VAKGADQEVASVIGVKIQHRIHVLPSGHYEGLRLVHVRGYTKNASAIQRRGFALDIGDAMGRPQTLESVRHSRQGCCVKGGKVVLR
jgi:hypothetical protein